MNNGGEIDKLLIASKFDEVLELIEKNGPRYFYSNVGSTTASLFLIMHGRPSHPKLYRAMFERETITGESIGCIDIIYRDPAYMQTLCETRQKELNDINKRHQLEHCVKNPECLELLYKHGMSHRYIDGFQTPELLAISLKYGGIPDKYDSYINKPEFIPLLLTIKNRINDMKLDTVVNEDCIKILYKNGHTPTGPQILLITNKDFIRELYNVRRNYNGLTEWLKNNSTYKNIVATCHQTINDNKIDRIMEIDTDDLEFKDDKGKDAAYHAVKRGNIEVIKYIYDETGFDVYEEYKTEDNIESPISLAIDDNDTEIVEFLLKNNIECITSVYSDEDTNYNALEYAIYKENYKMMRFIVKLGFPLYDENKEFDVMEILYSSDAPVYRRMRAYIKPKYKEICKKIGLSDVESSDSDIIDDIRESVNTIKRRVIHTD